MLPDFILGGIFCLLNITNKTMEPTQINHFPWTTSMMVFIIDKDGRILLKENDNRLNTFKLDTTGDVIIRNMVCKELLNSDILAYPEDLKHQGILNYNGRNFFVYTVNEFATNSPIPSLDSFWYSIEEIPFDRLDGFEKHILTMILDGEKIGF